MSSTDGDDAPSTRPISVAELLARHGTIGAPPAGGHRRRRRGNRSAVTVAELTGEIPVIRDEPPAPEADAETDAEPEATAESEPAVEIESEDDAEAVAEAEPEPEPEPEPEAAAEPEPEPEAAAEPEPEPEAAAEPEPEPEAAAEPEPEPEAAAEPEPEPEPPAEPTDAAQPAGDGDSSAPPLSSDPLPRRGSGPELSHDPRPLRRSSGAEQMAYDPVDESVDIAELVGEAVGDTAVLRSYLTASGGTLFSGETVADDLARRGIDGGAEPSAGGTPIAATQGLGKMAALRIAAVAAAQSVFAVIFGAGLFIGFDQLWRWNTIVALVLSVLVILGLVVAVRVVRRTEDIASTLIAVAVGALVTLGPLALLQSYG